MAVADERKLTELLDGSAGRPDREPPTKRPAAHDGENLRVDELRRVSFSNRAQHPRDAGGSVRREQEVDNRGGVNDQQRSSIAAALVDKRVGGRLGHLDRVPTRQTIEHLGHRGTPGDLDQLSADERG